MEKENTAIRLKKIMKQRELRQIDILNLTRPLCKQYNVKMNKSDISQYCSGKTEPNQEKKEIMSKHPLKLPYIKFTAKRKTNPS